MNKSEAGRLGALASLQTQREIRAKNRANYHQNPVKCLVCSGPIKFEERLKGKFCSRSCAGTYNGSRFVKRERTLPRCIKCQRLHNNTGPLCRDHHIEEKIERGEVHERPTLRRWLLKKNGHVCEICSSTTWQNQPIPLELDHKDGNPTNDLPENLRMVCPNCHAQMPTSKGRNRGNGRTVRGLRRIGG